MTDKKFSDLSKYLSEGLPIYNPNERKVPATESSFSDFFVVSKIETGSQIPFSKWGDLEFLFDFNFFKYKEELMVVDNEIISPKDDSLCGRIHHDQERAGKIGISFESYQKIQAIQNEINTLPTMEDSELKESKREYIIKESMEDVGESRTQFTQLVEEGVAMCVEKSALAQYRLQQHKMESMYASGAMSDGVGAGEHAFVFVKDKGRIFIYDPNNPVIKNGNKEPRIMDTGMDEDVFKIFLEKAKVKEKPVALVLKDKTDDFKCSYASQKSAFKGSDDNKVKTLPHKECIFKPEDYKASQALSVPSLTNAEMAKNLSNLKRER